MNKCFPNRKPKAQRGVVLVVCLLMLLLVTMLAVTALQSTTLQEKMAGNQQERHKSLQAAEAAALFAWTDLNTATYQNTDGTLKTGKFINNADQAGLYDLRPANTVAGNKLIANWNAISLFTSEWPWDGTNNEIAVMTNKVAAGDPMKLATAPQYVIGMYAPILRKGTENRKCIPLSIIGAGQGSIATSRSLIMLHVIPKSGCFRDPVS